MGHTTRITWSCDRCGTEEVITGTGSAKQPEGWAGLLVATPPLAVPEDKHNPRRHLCGECKQALEDFMARKVDIPAFAG